MQLHGCTMTRCPSPLLLLLQESVQELWDAGVCLALQDVERGANREPVLITILIPPLAGNGAGALGRGGVFVAPGSGEGCKRVGALPSVSMTSCLNPETRNDAAAVGCRGSRSTAGSGEGCKRRVTRCPNPSALLYQETVQELWDAGVCSALQEVARGANEEPALIRPGGNPGANGWFV